MVVNIWAMDNHGGFQPRLRRHGIEPVKRVATHCAARWGRLMTTTPDPSADDPQSYESKTGPTP
ncbi:hypothetical protein FIU94_10020 [Sulfitobacter sp. THAF37]|nr:hypothetical protein FIU94_10020 [Sulfitobacter sp. THAF37]